MPINFIVNDPAVQGATVQVINPSPDRTGSKVTFVVSSLPPEQTYPQNTSNFVSWQAREAALRTLNTFEASAQPLSGWMGQSTKKKLDLRPNDGQDLNAYYNRASISFFEFPLGARNVYSGASTDVVAHEAGHAILDAIRPDLWNVKMFEVPAFHEGFGDCIALMTALSDKATRVAILAKDPTLNAGNFVEATAEELSAAIGKAMGPNHNAAKPRQALNTFQWTLPQALPSNGKPGVLINEIHSFGQLTSGCYYELIREIFRAGPGGEAGLWQACQTATKLLALAAVSAPIRPRFLETVGRTMILVDRQTFSGKNETHIRTAFQRHGIALSITNFLAPRMALTQPGQGARKARKAGARKASKTPSTAAAFLPASAKLLLNSLLDAAPKAKLETELFAPADNTAAQVVSYHSVDLSGLSERLENVKAHTPYSTLVGSSGGSPAVLGAIDPGAVISSEVRNYVSTLVERGQIDFGDKATKAGGKKAAAGKKAAGKKAAGKKTKAAKRPRRGPGAMGLENRPVFELKRTGGEVVIERVSFACGCPRTRLLRCVSA